MAHRSLLDIESDQRDDRPSSTDEKLAIMDDLITTVAVIKSNYATKADLAAINGKLDVLISLQQNYATKAELSDAVYQLTWRMAGFSVATLGTMIAAIGAMVAVMRYL